MRFMVTCEQYHYSPVHRILHYFSYDSSVCIAAIKSDCVWISLADYITLAARHNCLPILLDATDFIISYGKYRVSFSGATPPKVWAVGWVGYVNTISEPTGNSKRHLWDKVMNMYIMLSLYIYVYTYKVKQSRYRPGVAQRVPGS